MTTMNMTPRHHPSEDMLLEYATGSMNEQASVLIATHLALCPTCRSHVHDLESLGGALIDDIEPAAVGGDARQKVMAMLDQPESAPLIARREPDFSEATRALIPEPLRSRLAGDIDSLPWRTVGRGIRDLKLAGDGNGFQSSLIRIRPGEAVPQHTHHGNELTLVLKGAFTDETGLYARGDVAFATSDIDHQPVAEADEECLCFAVVDGGLRLTGPVGRFLNVFVRY